MLGMEALFASPIIYLDFYFYYQSVFKTLI